MKRPLVSVLMASYNPGHYLRPALESVLAQTYVNMDLIVVDDGSTDGSLDAVQDLLESRAIRLVRQENSGRPRALNRALEMAQGDFYIIQDADDVSYPNRIERQLEMMDLEPDLACVMTGNDLIIDDRTVAPTSRSKGREQCGRDIEEFRMPAHDPTAMYRRAMVADMRYDPELVYVEAYDYTLRVGERFPMKVIGECLYSYRIHRSSITKRAPAQRQRMVREALRRACMRRGRRYEEVFGEEPQGVERRIRNRDIDNNLAAHFMESAVDLRVHGKGFDALRTGLYCASLQPFDPYYYKALVYGLLPPSTTKWLRALGRNGSNVVKCQDTVAGRSP